MPDNISFISIKNYGNIKTICVKNISILAMNTDLTELTKFFVTLGLISIMKILTRFQFYDFYSKEVLEYLDIVFQIDFVCYFVIIFFSPGFDNVYKTFDKQK